MSSLRLLTILMFGAAVLMFTLETAIPIMLGI